MAASFELTLFQEYYTKLCHTITDIEDLVYRFVQERIISGNEADEIIDNQNDNTEKVKNLLRHISGPLEVSDNQGFYIMLEIMKNHGALATSNLAEEIKSRLIRESNLLYNYIDF